MTVEAIDEPEPTTLVWWKGLVIYAALGAGLLLGLWIASGGEPSDAVPYGCTGDVALVSSCGGYSPKPTPTLGR